MATSDIGPIYTERCVCVCVGGGGGGGVKGAYSRVDSRKVLL